MYHYISGMKGALILLNHFLNIQDSLTFLFCSGFLKLCAIVALSAGIESKSAIDTEQWTEIYKLQKAQYQEAKYT